MAEPKHEEIMKKENNQSQVSRREFLKDAGILVGGATVGSFTILNACSGATKTTTITSPGTTVTKTGTSTITVTSPTGTGETQGEKFTITLTVNSKKYELTVKANQDLRQILREQVGYTSVKDMCYGYGACGSCGVIMDGRPVLSCMVLAAECDGAVIETAEGLAAANHPLVEAYVDNYCAQCGYCTPGFLITAKVLLDRNPKPNEAEIREALAGNMCRCGTYPQHIKAVLAASKQS